MRFLRTSVRIKNTLYNSNNSMDDASEYAEYLNNLLAKDNVIDNKTYTYKSELFGNIKINLFFDYIIQDDWDSIVFIKFNIPENKSEEDVYDSFEQDYKLQSYIKDCVEDFIECCNTDINIKHPINENLIYRHGSLYMEIDNFTHIPQWVDLQLDTNINTQELIDSICITQY